MVAQYNIDAERERFKALLEAAQDELIDAIRERESITLRMEKLQRDIRHLAALCDQPVEDPVKTLGLTDGIRYVLGNAKNPSGHSTALTPTEVRDRLAAGGFDTAEYSNVMASIHSVLHRLRKKGEALPTSDGRFVWTGRGLTPPPPMPNWLRERLDGGAVPRARTAPGSSVAQQFAEEDAKKKK